MCSTWSNHDYSDSDYNSDYSDSDYSDSDYNSDYSDSDYSDSDHNSDYSDSDYSDSDYNSDYRSDYCDSDYRSDYSDSDYRSDYSDSDYNSDCSDLFAQLRHLGMTCIQSSGVRLPKVVKDLEMDTTRGHPTCTSGHWHAVITVTVCTLAHTQ